MSDKKKTAQAKLPDVESIAFVQINIGDTYSRRETAKKQHIYNAKTKKFATEKDEDEEAKKICIDKKYYLTFSFSVALALRRLVPCSLCIYMWFVNVHQRKWFSNILALPRSVTT